VSDQVKDIFCDGFQSTVDELLVRHRSILDVTSKLQESEGRINRAVAKAVTTCGCVRINADKQRFPTDADFHDLRSYMSTHLEGKLCEHCEEIVESEIGNHLFYLAALCNLLGVNLYDTMIKEQQRLSTLGNYHF
jgi:hypothetical protein